MTAKAKLVKTKRAKVKRPRLWAVVWRDDTGWGITNGHKSKRSAEEWIDSISWPHKEYPRVIEIPPATLE